MQLAKETAPLMPAVNPVSCGNSSAKTTLADVSRQHEKVSIGRGTEGVGAGQVRRLEGLEVQVGCDLNDHGRGAIVEDCVGRGDFRKADAVSASVAEFKARSAG